MGRPAAARRRMRSDGSQRAWAEQNRRPPANLKNPSPFLSLPSLSSLGGGDGRAGRRRGRARAARGKGADGTAEPRSPDPRAALVGARLRRAVLNSALKRPPARA